MSNTSNLITLLQTYMASKAAATDFAALISKMIAEGRDDITDEELDMLAAKTDEAHERWNNRHK